MILQSYSDRNLNFGQADVNILALSDTHADLKSYGALYQNFSDNKKDVFEKKDASSTLNMFAVVGDWFMNPKQNGFLSDKNKCSGDFQAEFLDTFISGIKKFVPNLKTVFTIGNHDLDGGSDLLLNKIKNIDMDTIITNADFDETKIGNDRIFRSKVFEVQDDKDSYKKHKVLAIGLLPVNLDYLVKEDFSDLNMIDSKNVKEADLRKEDFDKTCEAVASVVNKFKKENPDSAVVLLNHAGEPVAKRVSEIVGKIDLVLNAHDHQDKVSHTINKDGTKTKIISLGENSQKFEGIKLHFDDNGKLSIFSKPYYTNFDDKAENPLSELYNETFKKDLAPVFALNTNDEREYLDINNVRFANNDIANFCTDSIFDSLKKEYPDLNAFTVCSTAFRQSIPTSNVRALTNLDLMELFKGISGDLSEVMVGKMSGKEIVSFIYGNVYDNLLLPHRNALNQWSGVKINKSAIRDFLGLGKHLNGQNYENICEFIQIKNNKGEFEKINPDKEYTIALPKKLFVKSSNQSFRDKQNYFEKTNKSVYEYFSDFASNIKDDVDLNFEARIF